MSNLYTFGCSLTHSSNWPVKLANKLEMNLINVAVPAGDNITQCRRFIDLFLHGKIKQDDIILWEITYLDRMGFRLHKDHHFLTRSKNVVHNLHTFETNIFDDTKHLDYVAFNHEWYETWYYSKNITQLLQELIFVLVIANQLVNNKCLLWFAQNNLFENNQDKEFCSTLDKHNILHLDYQTQSLMSWVQENGLPLAEDGMHPTESVYDKFVEKFIEQPIKKFVTEKNQ
jgi:hypothetical protein